MWNIPTLRGKLIKGKSKLSLTEQIDLNSAFEYSKELKKVYEIKHMFQAIFDAKFPYKQAVKQLTIWIEKARQLNNKYVEEFIVFLNDIKLIF